MIWQFSKIFLYVNLDMIIEDLQQVKEKVIVDDKEIFLLR